jgi:hypothetical protein
MGNRNSVQPVFDPGLPTPPDVHDFVEQLRRHTIEYYGQHAQHKGLLSDPELQAALRTVIGYSRRTLGRSNFDDAYVDAVPFEFGPAWMRRFVAIPRCTNSLSLYMFLVADVLTFLASIKLARFVVRRWIKPETDDGDGPWYHTVLPRLMSFPITIGAITLMFYLLKRKWSWIEEPHLLLTVTITLYLVGFTYLDKYVPDAT